MMRHANRLAIGGSIYRPQDSRVRDRELIEIGYRHPRRIAYAIIVAVSLGGWAVILGLVAMIRVLASSVLW